MNLIRSHGTLVHELFYQLNQLLMPAIDNKQEILRVSEEMIRQNGYNGFSFRNVATAIGIKSSSVHYHFRTKEDLGAAVTRAYTERFISSLKTPQALKEEGIDPLDVYVNAFRSALVGSKQMCLCGIFGAEAEGLPEVVVQETREFFKQNIKWLTEAYQLKGMLKANAHSSACVAVSMLEGALISSFVMASEDTSSDQGNMNTEIFEHCVDALKRFVN